MRTRFNSSLLEITAIAALALTGCDAGKVDAPQHALLLSALHVAPTAAKAGDTLTISFSASDQPAEDPTVSVDGQAATFLRVDELTYTYTYVVTGEESEGAVAVAASAIGADGIEASVNGSATLDFTLPEVPAIAATPNPAKAGDTLAIIFDVSEPLQANPEVTVGSSAAAYLDLVGQTYTYSYPVTGAESEPSSVIDIRVTDVAGNSGSASTSTGFDFIAPSFDSIDVVPALAKAGDTLSIIFAASESLAGTPTITVDGNVATFESFGASTFAFSYTAVGTESPSADITITGTDSAGNVGVGAATAAFDFVAPTFSSLVVSPSPAKLGDSLSITFDSSELLALEPTVTVDGNSASLVSVSAPTYTYAYTIAGTESETDVTVAVSSADEAGNSGYASTTVRLDFAAPSLSSLSVSPDPAAAGNTLTIAFDSSEALLPNPVVTVDGNNAAFVGYAAPTYTFSYTVSGAESEGAVTVQVDGSDAAGNTATTLTGSVTLDFSAPVFSSIATDVPRAAAGDTITITFDTDQPLSGNLSVTVDGLDAAFVSLAGTTYTYSYTVTGLETEGQAAIAVAGNDAAGNRGDDAGSVALDFSGPTFSLIMALPDPARAGASLSITFDTDEPAAADPTVTIDGLAAGYSGYSAPTYTYTYTVIGPGTESPGAVTIAISGQDVVGNSGNATGSLTLDFQPPTITTVAASPDPAKAGDALSITFDSDEPLAAGTSVTVDGHAATFVGYSAPTYTYSYTVTGTEAEGPVSLDVDGSDAAGNTTLASGTVTLDYTPPSFSSIGATPNPAAIGDTLTITFAANEPISGVPSVTVDGYPASFSSFSDPTYTFLYTVTGAEQEGANAIAVGGVDLAGNSGSGSGSVTLDVTEPTVAGTFPVQGATSAGVSSTIRVTFSEPIASATINGSSFTVAGVSGTVSYDAATQTATFAPDAPLAYSTLHSATVGTAVQDLLGNGMVADFTWSFTTEPNTGAYISGSLTLPPSWVDAWVAEETGGYTLDAVGNSFSILVDRRSDNVLYAWDDGNANGAYDPGVEPRIPYYDCFGLSYLDTSGGGVSNADIVSVNYYGNVQVPGSWSNTKVYDEASGNCAVPGAAGDYSIDVGMAWSRLYAFDDGNDNNVFDSGEGRLQIAETGPCFPITSPPYDLTVHQVSGTVLSEPSGWNTEVMAVVQWTDPPQVAGTKTPVAGAYSVEISDGSYWVFAYDDANSDGQWQAGEARIAATTPVDNATGDVSGIDIEARTISGTATPPATWTAPAVGVLYSYSQFCDAVTGLTAGAANAYSLDVGATGYNQVFMFDDLDSDGIWGANEPRIDYPGNPVDTTYVDATNIDIGAKSLSGTITPLIPPTWSAPRVRVLQDTAALYSDVIGNAYSTDVGSSSWTNVCLFDDVNGDGVFDINTEPQIQHRWGPFSTLGTGPFTADIDVCAVTGSVNPPPGWGAPMVAIERMFIPVAAYWGPITGGTYTGYTSRAADQSAYMFDDTDANGRMNDNEPRIGIGATFSTDATCSATNIDLDYRTISGTVQAPPAWARPRVYSTIDPYSTATPDAAGAYTMYVRPTASQAVYLFDDLNNNGVRDMFPAVEPQIAYDANPVDTSASDATGIDIAIRSISGRLTPPAGWQNPVVIEKNSLISAAADLNNDYVLIVGASADNVVAMFDDRNHNGIPDIFPTTEPLIHYALNPVDTSTANATHIDIDYVTITGVAAIPPDWTNPVVAADPWVYTSTATPDAAGNYELAVDRGLHLILMFEDSNANGNYEFTELRLDYDANMVDTSGGSVAGIDIAYRTISGKAFAPPSWSNPKVYDSAPPFCKPAIPDANNDYALYVTADTSRSPVLWNDANDNGVLDAGEPSIPASVPVDTTGGDVSGVDLFAIIQGAFIPPPDWGDPQLVLEVAPASLANLASGSGGGGPDTYDVAAKDATFNTVIMFDDLDHNGAHDAGEAAVQYCPGGTPAAVDISAGSVYGVNMVDGSGDVCAYP